MAERSVGEDPVQGVDWRRRQLSGCPGDSEEGRGEQGGQLTRGSCVAAWLSSTRREQLAGDRHTLQTPDSQILTGGGGALAIE